MKNGGCCNPSSCTLWLKMEYVKWLVLHPILCPLRLPLCTFWLVKEYATHIYIKINTNHFLKQSYFYRKIN